MRACPAFTICLLMSVCSADARDGETFPAPRPNLPWEHESTGLRLPFKLADMAAEEVFRYAEASLGFSVRYSDPKARLRGDVYVYPCPQNAETAEEIKKAAGESAGRAVWEVEEMQRRGHYKKLKMGDAEYQPFDLIPESAGVSGLLSLPMEYTIVERNDAGESENTVGSFLGIMVLKNHFVKVRVTFPMDGGAKEKAAMEERVRKFINAARRCVLDPGLRAQAAEHIEKYRREPLSEAGHDAAGGILAYADITPMITLTIDDTISTLGDDLKKDFPDAALELLRAFIAGAVAESLKKPGVEAPDLPQAGAEEMLRVFAAMQKARPGLVSARVTELEAAVKQKKATAWLREQAVKRGQ